MGKFRAVLTVHVWEGINLASKDSNGLSDPYCVVSVIPTSKPSKAKTKVKKETLNPTWQEVFNFKLEHWESSVLKIECLDWDRFGSPDFMGQFSIPVADIEGELIDSYFTLLPRDGKNDAVSGKIRIQAHVKVTEQAEKGGKPLVYSDTIDKERYKSLDAPHIERQEALFQLIQCEKKYQQDLHHIIADYYSPLKSILSAGALEYLFQNIEEIARTSTRFLQALQERQKENDFVIMKIGDVVEPFIKQFKCYIPYCTNHNLISERLQSLMQATPELSSFFTEDKDASALEVALKLPKKRLLRYQAQLGAYLNTLPGEHVDKESLPLVIDQLQNLIAEINNQVREKEFVISVQHLYRSLEKAGQHSLMTNAQDKTRFVESITKVTILQDDLNTPAIAILFEDSIVFIKQNKKEPISVLHQFGLLSATFTDLPDCIEYQHSMKLKTSEVTLRIEMPTAQSKVHWLAAAEHYQQALLYENMMLQSRGLDEEAEGVLEQAHTLIEQYGQLLPIEYVNTLEEMLNYICDQRSEQEQTRENITQVNEQLHSLNDRAHQLNKAEAHANLTNSGSTIGYLAVNSATATGSAIKHGVDSFMKRPSNLFASFAGSSKEEIYQTSKF